MGPSLKFLVVFDVLRQHLKFIMGLDAVSVEAGTDRVSKKSSMSSRDAETIAKQELKQEQKITHPAGGRKATGLETRDEMMRMCLKFTTEAPAAPSAKTISCGSNVKWA